KEVARWSKLIVGQVWKSFHRKGKYLEVELANDWRLVVHLRMTGQLLLSPSSGLRPPSPALPREKAKPCPLPAEDGRGWRSPGEGSRLRLCFANGKILRLVDQRRFAEIWLLRPGEAWRSRNPLGPDALTELKRDE